MPSDLASVPEPSRLPPQAKPFPGVPTFVRGLCATAANGGGDSYRHVGFSFACCLPSLDSYDYEAGEFGARLALLADLLRSGDRKAILGWFREEYPACMRLVPHRRRQLFVEGVLRAFNDGKMGFLP